MSKKFDYDEVDETCRSLANKQEQIQYLIEVARNNDIDEPLEFAQCTLEDLQDLWAEENYQAFYGDSM